MRGLSQPTFEGLLPLQCFQQSFRELEGDFRFDIRPQRVVGPNIIAGFVIGGDFHVGQQREIAPQIEGTDSLPVRSQLRFDEAVT